MRELKGHRYLYFWSYEVRSWGPRRTWRDVGPVSRLRTGARARQLLLEYHRWVRKELDRRVATLESVAARAR